MSTTTTTNESSTQQANGKTPRAKLTKKQLADRKAKSAATRAANKLVRANGAQTGAQTTVAGAAARTSTAKTPARTTRVPQHQPIATQQQQRATLASGLMLSLFHALPPEGSEMSPEKAAVWLKAIEANFAVAYNLPAEKIAA